MPYDIDNSNDNRIEEDDDDDDDDNDDNDEDDDLSQVLVKYVRMSTIGPDFKHFNFFVQQHKNT